MDKENVKVDEPTVYELDVLKNIRKTKKKNAGKFDNWIKGVKVPLEKATAWLQQIPGLEAIKEKTIDLLSTQFNQFKTEENPFSKVIEKYQASGFLQIKEPEDITSLHLDDINPLIGDICKKYQTLTESGEEETPSTLSLQSMPGDIVALINLNRKAVNEYAVHYGFDISLEKERLFALSILEYAAANSEHTKEEIMGRLITQTKQMAGEKSKKLSKAAFLSMFSTLSSSISIKLLKAKVGDGFPIHGAVIGSGFNAYFTNEVCSAAQFFYQQRFLAKKYGSHVIELNDREFLDQPKDEN